MSAKSAYVKAIALAALAVWAMAALYLLLHTVCNLYSPLPVQDYWRVSQMLDRYRHFDLRVLWIQHNEHRIVFPEILYAADMLFFRGLKLLPIGASALCYLGTFGLFALVFALDKQLESFVRWSGILMAAILAGWGGSATVLADAFLLQWTLVQFAMAGALVLVSVAGQRRRNGWLSGSIALAVAATYSSGSGLLVWPVLIGAALLLRFSRRQIAALTLSGAVSIGVYFIGYRPTGELHLANLILHPEYALRFVCSFLSVPFNVLGGPRMGIDIGLISLSTAVVLFVVAYRKGLLTGKPAVALFGFYLLTLLTAVLTAAGRMDVNDATYAAAKAPRYLTAPLETWAAWILLLVWISERCQQRVIAPAAMAFASLLLLFSEIRGWIRDKHDEFAQAQMVAVSFESGLISPEVTQWIFPHPEFIRLEAEKLHRNHLSIYANDQTVWLGRNLAEFGRVAKQKGTGQITCVTPILSGLQIVGWGYDGHAVPRYRSLVLANEANRIVGFGRFSPAGFPSFLRTPTTPDSLAWVGFVNTTVPTKSFSAFWVDRRSKQLIEIPGSKEVPLIEVATPASAGVPLPVNAQYDAARVSDAVTDVSRFSDIPRSKIYSTWNASDQNTATISLLVQRPPEGCIILPVLNGPSQEGLRVAVLNAANDQVIASIPMQIGAVRWEFWRIPIDPQVPQVKVQATDSGQSPGQWVAVAGPESCR